MTGAVSEQSRARIFRWSASRIASRPTPSSKISSRRKEKLHQVLYLCVLAPLHPLASSAAPTGCRPRGPALAHLRKRVRDRAALAACVPAACFNNFPPVRACSAIERACSPAQARARGARFNYAPSVCACSAIEHANNAEHGTACKSDGTTDDRTTCVLCTDFCSICMSDMSTV